MKKKIMGVAAAVLAVAGGIGAFAAYRWVALPGYGDADEGLIATEESLATPDLVLLGSLDIGYLRTLDTKLHGTPRLPDLVVPEPQSTSVLDEVRRSLARQYDALAFVATGLYLTQEGPATVLVSGGNLRAEQAIAFLKNHPHAKPAPNLPNAWVVQSENPDTCELSKEWTILVDQDRVIATDARDMQIIERVQGRASAARDLARWREFRGPRFAAAALFLPSALPNEGIDPLTRSLAKGAQDGLRDFEAIYLGAGAVPFPPKADLSLWFAVRSAETATQKASAWQAALAASRKDWQQSLPTFAALHDRARITTRENLLVADMRVDEAFVEQLANVPAELLGLVFSGFKMQAKAPEPSGAAPQEQLERDPPQFFAVVTPDQLKAYDPKVPFVDVPDAIVGPFGIHLAAVRLAKGEPRATELEIVAKGTHLPNLADGADAVVELAVNSVKDAGGKELLRVERCGRDRNGHAATGNKLYGQPVVEVKKTVRLAEAVRVNDVAGIEGVIRARLPVRVETVALKAPKVGDHIEREQLRIEITRAGKGSIVYRVSGDTARLLHVRGKNAKGQVLASGSRSSFGSGSAKSMNHEFHGEAAEVEFVLAQAVEELNFPFALTNAWPRVAEPMLRPQPLAFGAYAPAQLKRDLALPFSVKRHSSPKGSANAGPGVVDLEYVQPFMNLNLHLSLYLPRLRNLEGALTATELEIDSLTFEDGSVQRPADGQPGWRAFVPVSAFGNDPRLHGRVQVETGLKADGKTALQSLAGRVSLRLPVALKPARVSALAIGAAQDSACGPVTVSEIARTRVTLEGAGDPACIFAVRAFDAQGQELWARDGTIQRTGQGWELQFAVTGIAETLELVAASKVQKLSYGFTLKVNEADAQKTGAASGGP